MSDEPFYSAFISYSHADNRDKGRQWASWLHKQLEEYAIPADLIGKPNILGQPIPRSLYPVFRDRDDLQVTSEGKKAISDALTRSGALIVLCSPRSASQDWVSSEIAAWQALGRNARIFPVLIDGDPLRGAFPPEFDPKVVIGADFRPAGQAGQGYTDASEYREMLLRENVYSRERIELLSSNYRDQLVSEMVRLVAGLLGIAPNRLVNREAAQRARLAEAHARRTRHVLLAVTTLATIALAAILYGWFLTKQNAWAAEQAAAKDRLINQIRVEQLKTEKDAAERATAAAFKLGEAQAQRSRAEAAAAVNSVLALTDNLLEKNRPQDALAYLADICRRYPDAPDAATRLFALLSGNRWPMPVSAPVRLPPGPGSENSAPIERARFSPDGRFIVTSRYGDVVGKAEVWSAADFSLISQDIPANTVGSSAVWHPLRPDETFFSADGSFFASTSATDDAAHPPSISLLNLRTRELRTHTDHCPKITTLGIGPDGLPVTGTADGQIIHWTPDLRPGQSSAHFPGGIAALSADGRTALLSKDGKFTRIPTQGPAHPAQGQRLPIEGRLLGCSPQLDLIVTESKTDEDPLAAEVSVWRQNPAQGEKAVQTQRIDGSVLYALSVSKESIPILACLTAPAELRERVGVVDCGPAGGKFLHDEMDVDPQEGFHPYDARVSKDRKWLATVSPDLTARVWTMETPGLPARFVMQAVYECSSVDLSPDARRWLIADDVSGSWRLWSLDSNVRPPAAVRLLEGIGTGAKVWVRGAVVGFRWAGGSVAYDLAARHETGFPADAEIVDKQEAPLPETLFNADRSRKLVRGEHGTSLVDTASGKELAKDAPTLNGFARFSPDGGKVLLVSDGSRGRSLQFLDAATGQPLGVPIEANNCEKAGFSAEGDCAWAYYPGAHPSLALYDVASRRRFYGPVENPGLDWVWVAGGIIHGVSVESGPGNSARAVAYEVPYRIDHADPLMCDLAEAIASRHISAGGAVEMLPSSRETFREIAARLPQASGDKPFLSWAHWLLRERDSELGRHLSE